MNNQPNTGAIVTCARCGLKIKFDGTEWKHLGVHFRHPAEPVTATKPTRDPQPHLTAILQPAVQYQVEADGDALWA